jgi:hypothetical protein
LADPHRHRRPPRRRPDGPAVFDGPIDNPTFLAYVEQVVVPTLRPGDVVVLDNLAMHKQAEVQAAIEGARPRSFDQVVELMTLALELFPPSECLNCVRHCGYGVSTAP